MSSSKFILKCITAVTLPHWSAQKESGLNVRSFKGLNTIYENISNIIVASHKFFINFLRNCFLFLIQGKLIALKYAGKQLIY